MTGKLAVDGQNLIYCVRFEENVQKPLKKADFWKCANIISFWTISSYGKIGYLIWLLRYNRVSNAFLLSTNIV